MEGGRGQECGFAGDSERMTNGRWAGLLKIGTTGRGSRIKCNLQTPGPVIVEALVLVL